MKTAATSTTTVSRENKMSAFDQHDRLVKMKVTSESIKEISDEDLEVLGEIYADDQFGTHIKTMRIVTAEIARRYGA